MLFWLLVGVFSLAKIDAASDERLLLAIAIWRHGERAPDHHLSIASNNKFFKYGLKELTENGIQRSFELGRYFQKRYADGVFMSKVLNNSEVYIQSVERDRCMMTAVAVGQGMYSASGREVPVPVPVHTRLLKTDSLLALPWSNCPMLAEEFGQYCTFPALESFDGNFPLYEKALFECSQAGKDKKFFNNATVFDEIETLLAEEFAGADLPTWYTKEASAEAKDVYYQVQRFMLGLGQQYHNKRILRAQSGLLLDTVIKELHFKWNCIHSTSKECSQIAKLKFKGISTQDYILNTLLESLGVREEAIGTAQNTQYNAAVLFELWVVKGQPQIKVLYKRGHNDSLLVNVSSRIRHCGGNLIACPLEDFVHCCTDYRTENPKELCDPTKN